MARARVQLRHCESFTGLSGGLSWTKNQSRTFTNPGKITYYKGNPEFVVTMLKEPKQAPPVSKPKPTAGDGDGGVGGSEGADAPEFSKGKLERMSKPELVDLAAERFGLSLDEDEMKKGDLVAALLEAQG